MVYSALKHGLRGLTGGIFARAFVGRTPRGPQSGASTAADLAQDTGLGRRAFRAGWPLAASRIRRGRRVPGERWSAINLALRLGLRGLPGGSSLAQLLAGGRRVPIRNWHVLVLSPDPCRCIFPLREDGPMAPRQVGPGCGGIG